MKLLLIGVYTDTLVVGSDELPIPRLSFVFTFRRVTDEQPALATFRFERSNGELVLPETTFNLDVRFPEATASNVLVHVAGIVLPADTYTVRLRVNGRTEFAGHFGVTVNPNLVTRIEGPSSIDAL
jgi:hypothetical protein